jgi:hypothetical protein
MKDVETFKKRSLLGFIPMLSGLPYFYIGDIKTGIIYTFTLGYMYIGSIYTFFKAGEIVDRYNTGRGYVNTTKRQ